MFVFYFSMFSIFKMNLNDGWQKFLDFILAKCYDEN